MSEERLSQGGFRTEEAESGLRLDVALVRRIPQMSRSKARALIAEGAVRVNGRPTKKGVRLSAGDEVSLARLPDPSDFDPEPDEGGGLRIVLLDPSLVVVDKAAGVPTHPLRLEDRGTLAQALLAAFPEMRGVGYRRREPGVLHRLDNDTSGLLLAARDRESFEALRAQLRAGEIDKRYLALVRGDPGAPREIRLPLAPDPRDRRRVCAFEEGLASFARGAREAMTKILRSDWINDEFYLVELAVASAQRHQIRAHLAAEGHPLAGDLLYGGPALAGLDRHFLHASELALSHPSSGAPIRLRSELPEELSSLLAEL